MDNEVAAVLRGFGKLTVEQRKEVMKAVEHYKVHGVLEESLRKSTEMQMGPLGRGCPCCGR